MASSSSSSSSLPSPPLQFPAEYLCPLTKKPMRDPVKAPCRHIFEKAAIVEWIKNNPSCPVGCDAQISSTQLIPNPTLRDTIAQFAESSAQRVRLQAKMQGVSTSEMVHWDESRIMTPGGLFAYKTRGGITFCRANGGENVTLYTGTYEEELGYSGTTRIMLVKEDSQGLFVQDGQQSASGVSVTTKIKAQTVRQKESAETYVQYDKKKVILEGKDFSVNPINYRSRTFYEGGHLIDHQFSAGTSHYDVCNYFPVHFYYNSPLKNYLVNRCDAYVEIPLYTPNPPMIRVLKIDKKKPPSELYHPIPIGMIFVQIRGGDIQDVYYFPNNDVDYKSVADRSTRGQTASETIIPYFKLKKNFHQLLCPAIITDLLSVINGEELQKAKEDIFFQVVDKITTGLTLEECFDVAQEITKLGFAALDGEVKPSLLLDSRADLSPFPDALLALPFKVLGDFLIRYGMANALKCETLSIKTRLIFLSVIVSFICEHIDLKEEALDYIDQFNPQYRSILTELDGIMSTMNEEELLFLANIQVQIADKFNHDFSPRGYEIYNHDDLLDYFAKAVQTIRLIDEKYDVTSFSHDHGWNFLQSIVCVQTTLDYIVDTEFPEEEYKEESLFLISLRKKCMKLEERLKREPHRKSAFGLTFQTNVRDTVSWRTSSGYLKSIFSNLGAHCTASSDDESSSGLASSFVSEGIEQSASSTISSGPLISAFPSSPLPQSTLLQLGTDSVPIPSFSTTELAEIELLDKSTNDEFLIPLAAAEEISSDETVKEAEL